MSGRIVSIIAEALNEYAGLMARGEDLPRQTPSSPGFWFYGLAREQAALCCTPSFRRLLTREARAALNAKPSAWGRSRVKVVNGVRRAVAA